MSAKNTNFTFSMRITADEYERYYQGTVRNILVMTHQGVRVQFPASAVRPFVTEEGVSGNFMITMDANNKLTSLKQF